jgi:glycosyltransferase involved in cell wall biosynthesis
VPVGVVVPVHGWAPYLVEALDSVLAERPDAVVVVDDGSPEPLALHPEHAARCALVRREERGGPAAARNEGVAALPGGVDILAFCDHDDAWLPGKLSAQLAALEAAPDAAGCFGRATVVSPDGRPTGERWSEPPAGPLDPVELYEDNPVPTSSVVLRRSAFPGFDGAFAQAEDWELWLRIARSGALLCVPDSLVLYRRHAGGLTTDLVALGRAQRLLHETHADLVPPATRDRALARDRAGEAAGLVRAGRFAEARSLLPPSPRRAALKVPGIRALAGRRDPYRG